MHLDRERVAHVEKFQQQREPAEAPGQFSQQLLRPLLKQLPDGPSFERSIGDAAGMVIAVAQQPRFADGAIAGQRRGEQVGQTPATPEPILVDRFESKRIQRYLIHGMSLCCHAHVLSIAAVYSPRRAARLHWHDEAKLAAPLSRWPLCLAKSPKPVAGWRGQTKTPAPKAVAT